MHAFLAVYIIATSPFYDAPKGGGGGGSWSGGAVSEDIDLNGNDLVCTDATTLDICTDGYITWCNAAGSQCTALRTSSAGFTTDDNFGVVRSQSGGAVVLTAVNASNTANSDAVIRATTAGSSSGDPYFGAQVDTVGGWVWGTKRNSSNQWQLGYLAGVGPPTLDNSGIQMSVDTVGNTYVNGTFEAANTTTMNSSSTNGSTLAWLALDGAGTNVGTMDSDGNLAIAGGLRVGSLTEETTAGNINIQGDINVNGGDVTSAASTLNINAGGTVNITDNLTVNNNTVTFGLSETTTSGNQRFVRINANHADAGFKVISTTDNSSTPAIFAVDAANASPAGINLQSFRATGTEVGSVRLNGSANGVDLYSSNAMLFATNGSTTALTLATNQNATFAGDATVAGSNFEVRGTSGVPGSLFVGGDSSGSGEGGQITLGYPGNNAGTGEEANTWNIDVDTTAQNNLLRLFANGGAGGMQLTTAGNARLDGDWTVLGGDIVTGAAVATNLVTTTTTGSINIATALTSGALAIGTATGTSTLALGGGAGSGAVTIGSATRNIALASPNVTQSMSLNGDLENTVYNSRNSSGTDDAFYKAAVGGANAGDPMLLFDIAGASGMSMGLDNSDSDAWKLTDTISGVSSGNPLLRVGRDASLRTYGMTGMGTAPVANQELTIVHNQTNNVGAIDVSGFGAAKGWGMVLTPIDASDMQYIRLNKNASSAQIGFLGSFDSQNDIQLYANADLHVAAAANVVLGGTGLLATMGTGAGAGAVCISGATAGVVTYSAGASCTISSKRYKHNIKSSEVDADLIYKLRVVDYILNSDKTNQSRIGLIAEEAAEVLPQLAVVDNGKIESIWWERVTSLTVLALQELRELVVAHDDRIAELESRLATLEAQCAR